MIRHHRLVAPCLALPLFAAGCGVVRVGDPHATSGATTGSFVPASVHYRDGKVVADAFVQAEERANVTMTIEGAGAKPTPVMRRCSPLPGAGKLLHCRAISNETTPPYRPGFLDSQAAEIDKAAATPTPYTLKLLVDGAEVASHAFSLSKMPTVGNETTLVAAPKDRPATLVFDGYRVTAWVPIDGRAGWGTHYVRFAWISEGAVVESEDTEIAAPYLSKWVTGSTVDTSAPVLDVRPVPVTAPKRLEGPYTVVALLDGEIPIGTWDMAVRNGALVGDKTRPFGKGSPPVGYVLETTPAGDAVLAEAKKKHHVGPPTRPSAEPAVCAYAFEPAARPLLERAAKLSGTSWDLIGVASSGYQSAYRDLAEKAASEGRITADGKHVYVSQSELDAANRRGAAVAKPADDEKKKVEAEAKDVGKKLGDLAKKYEPGCLKKGLRDAGVTFAQ